VKRLHSAYAGKKAELLAVVITALTVAVVSEDCPVRVTVARAEKFIEGNARGVALSHTQSAVVKETGFEHHHPEAYSGVCTQARWH
jgi:hypothetical protein